MKLKYLTAIFLIFIMLFFPASCSQRRQSPPQQENTTEQEKGSEYIIYINTEPSGGYIMYKTDTSAKKKEKIYEKNPYSASGYGGRIAFLSEESGKQGLYMINADGSNLVSIMNNAAIKSNSLSWSPDGGRIVFVSRQALDKSDEIYYVEAGKYKTPVKITDDTSGDESPKFTSDGKIILYSKVTNNNYDIYKYDIAGQSHENISNNSANDLSPAVSPDGTRILFLSDEKEKGKYNLYMMNIDGGGRNELTSGLNIIKETVRISPDSRMVAFISMDDRRNNTVHIVDMNKSTVMISDDAYAAAWSSDSKKLYYATFDPKNRKIVEFDVTSKNPRDMLKIENKPGQESEGIQFLHFTDKLK